MKENFLKKMEENTTSNDNNNINSEPLRTSLEIMNNEDNKSENLMTKTQIPNQ